MKRLTEWALLMYPPEWRRRYGAELQCLLEDSGAPRARDIFDILKGGLIMRYSGANIIRMAITWGLTCGLLGLVLSGGVALAMPDLYRGEALLVCRVGGPPSGVALHPASLSAVVQQAIGDERLARMIGFYGLYGYQAVADRPYQRGQDPAEDVAMSARVEKFRRDIKVETLNRDRPHATSDAFLKVVYSGPVAGLTAQVANQLAAVLVEENLKQAAGPDSLRMTIISPARVPARPYRPFRLLIAMDGFAGGALLGIAIALLRRRPAPLAS